MSIVQVVRWSRQEARSLVAQAGIAAIWCVIGVVLSLSPNKANAADSDVIVYKCFSIEITFVNWNDPNENGDRFSYGEEEFSITVHPEIGIHADNWMLIDFSSYEIPSKPRYWDFNSQDTWSAISPDGSVFVRFSEGSLAISNMALDSGSMFTLLARCWG